MASIPEFWTKALEVIRAAPIAYLATVYGEQPSVRAVTPAFVGMTAYIATEPRSFKVRSTDRNPHVELMHWHGDFRHVRIRGIASMVEDEALKAKMWGEFGYDLADFFGEDRAEYGLMTIAPTRIELMSLQDYAANTPPLIWRAEE